MSAIDLMVRDVVTELAIRLHETRAKAEGGDEFEAGRRAGLRQALSMLFEQMNAFNIPSDYLGVDESMGSE